MKRPLLFTLFFVCAPVLLAARVIQQFYMLDPVSGFYLESFSEVGTVITIACIALIPALILTVWLIRPGEVIPAKRSISLGIAAWIAALSLVVSGVFGALSLTDKRQIIVIVFSFATAVVLAWHGVCSVTGNPYNGNLSLIGIVYGIVRLVIVFIGYTGEVTVTDTLFDIATMCLLLLFLYSSGKILCGVSGPRTSRLFYSYGLAAAFFCVDSFLAQTVMLFVSDSGFKVLNSHFDPSYLGLAIYIAVMIIVFSKSTSTEETNKISE